MHTRTDKWTGRKRNATTTTHPIGHWRNKNQSTSGVLQSITHDFHVVTDNISAINKIAGGSGRVVSASDCGVRGPRFESHRGQ